MKLRMKICLVLALCLSASVAVAQDSDADKAKAQMKEGIELYEQLKYDSAQTILLKVDADALTNGDRAKLMEYIQKVSSGLTKQAEAMEAYNKATAALRTNDLAKAEKLFATASESPHLQTPLKKDAAAQLALVREKISIQNPADSTDVKTPDMDTTTDVKDPDQTEDTTPQVDPAELERQRLMQVAAARRAEVMDLVTKGEKALQEERFAEAEKHFKNALALSPGLPRAIKGKSQASQALAASKKGDELTDTLQKMRAIRKQATLTDFQAAMKESLVALTEADQKEDFALARQRAQVARNELQLNKIVFSRAEYRNMMQQVDDQLANIDSKQTAFNERKVQEQIAELAKADRNRQERIRESRRQQVNDLVMRAQALRAEREYEQALSVVKEILTIEPDHQMAKNWELWLTQDVLTWKEKSYRSEMLIETQRLGVELSNKLIPWYDELRFPRNWKELSLKREKYSATSIHSSEEDREVRDALQKRERELSFDGTSFEEVIKFIREVSVINIHVNWSALEVLGITRDTLVTVQLNNITLEKALDIILSDLSSKLEGTGELDYIIDRGVITISTKDDLARKTSVEVYDIRDMIMPIRSFEGPDLGDRNNDDDDDNNNDDDDDGFNFGDDDDDDDDNNNDDDDDDNVSGPDQEELIENIVTLVQENVDPNSWRINGGLIGSVTVHNGQLVVTQTSKNHEAIQRLLNQLREENSLQISVEARFLTVSTGFLNDIGIDLDFVFNIGSGLGGADAAGNVGSIADPWTGTAVPISGASVWGNGKPGTSKVTPLPVSMGTSAFASMLGRSSGVPQGVGSSVLNPGLSVAGTFLDDIQVSFLLRATKAHASTRSLTAPRLTFTNGQRAYVYIGTSQAYVSALEPIVEQNVVGYEATVSEIGTGTMLEVMGTVSADRRYVTMELNPQVTVLNGFSSYFSSVSSVDANGNPQTGEGFIQLPNVTRQGVRTTVTVPDGGTLLLGGQNLAGEVEREMGVPMLSSIPIVNRLFTNRGMIRDENTLLILVKPKILIQQELEDEQRGE